MGIRGINSGFINPGFNQPRAINRGNDFKNPSSQQAYCPPSSVDKYQVSSDPISAAIKAHSDYDRTVANGLNQLAQTGKMPLSTMFSIREKFNQLPIYLALVKNYFKEQLMIIDSLLGNDRTKSA